MTIVEILTLSTAFTAFLAAIIGLWNLYKKSEVEFRKIHERQQEIIQQVNDFSRQIMTATLRIAPQFAFSPFPQLLPTISPSDISLFDRRRSHFSPEKELLAGHIVREIIRKKIDPEIGGKKDLLIILVLDAGSTVYPIFRILCTHPSFQFDRMNASRLKIVTNNLLGVSDLIKYGRIGDPIHARTLFDCRILRGYANSLYEASLSKHTFQDLNDAISEFKSECNKDCEVRVLSITTGNYVSIQDGILARDPNHQTTKNAMLDVADEVFVLAPLGKLLPYSCNEINMRLKLSRTEESYGTLQNWPNMLNKINMVVTFRQADYFRDIVPGTLGTHLGRVQAEIKQTFDEARLHSIPFDPRDDVNVRIQSSILSLGHALCEYEFPHQNLRDSLK